MAAGLGVSVAIGLAVPVRPALLGLAAAALGGLCALRWPRWFIVAAVPILILPIRTIGMPLPLDILVIAIAAAAWLVGLLQGRWPMVWRIQGPIAGLMLWLVIVSRLHPGSGLAEAAAPADLRTLELGLLLCAVAASVRPDPIRVVNVTAITVTGISVYTLLIHAPEGARLEALGLNPNYLGLLLAVGLSAATALAVTSSTAPWRIAWTGAAAVQVIALFDTRSRGAYIAAGAGLLLALVVARSWRVKAASVFAAVAVVVSLPGGGTRITSFALQGRTAQELELYTDARTRAGQLAVDYSLAHPITGIGYGRFAESAQSDSRLGIFINTHNEYLRLSAETGALGLMLFIALASVVFRLEARRRVDRAVLATTGAYLVGIFFANTLSNLQVSAPAWVLLGCAASMGRPRLLLRTGGSNTRMALGQARIDAQARNSTSSSGADS